MKSDSKSRYFRLDKVVDLAGFAATNMPKGHYGWVLAKSSVTSDEPDFYNYVEQLSDAFLNKIGIPADSVYKFLVLIRKDLSADIFVNDFRFDVEVMLKSEKKRMSAVYKKDIADVRKLRFPDVAIGTTDKVIFCLKVGWKFGLYFDLSRELDIEDMELGLGRLYRVLLFEYVFKVLESQAQFKEMMDEGWFPFIEIIGGDYEELSKTYADRFDFENRRENLIRRFDSERVGKITSKWWRDRVFRSRKPIIEAGINSFLRGGSDGYISCISALLTQVEGIIRLKYHDETGKSVRLDGLLSYLIEKGKAKGRSESSLLLPLPFLKYLQEVVYRDFNIESGELDLSRHSLSHGVANPEDYTKYRALQVILLMDQVYFYIGETVEKGTG